MKALFLSGMILISSVCLSADRFLTDEEKIEQAFSDVNENLGNIHLEVKALNQNQSQIIELLIRIAAISDQNKIVEWEN